MPLPSPKNKEKRSEFVSRCVSQISDEYKNNKQAVAICYNAFKEAKASADGVIDLGNDEEMLLFGEASQDNLADYQKDFFEMSSSSIVSIAKHAQNIVDALEDPVVKKNLQESWLQGKIAITEQDMLTIHNFVMFSKSE
jgi:hypothetical protein